jgi:hypothetical protein
MSGPAAPFKSESGRAHRCFVFLMSRCRIELSASWDEKGGRRFYPFATETQPAIGRAGRRTGRLLLVACNSQIRTV